MRLAVSLLFAAAWTPVAPIHAQRADTTVRVAVGFGVDTGSIPNQEIFALWRTYLSSRPGCLQPAPLWSPSEQARWPVVDLLCSYVYQGFTRYRRGSRSCDRAGQHLPDPHARRESVRSRAGPAATGPLPGLRDA